MTSSARADDFPPSASVIIYTFIILRRFSWNREKQSAKLFSSYPDRSPSAFYKFLPLQESLMALICNRTDTVKRKPNYS